MTAEVDGAVVRARFFFDTPTGALTYDVTVSGVDAADIHGVTLHRGQADEVGPILYRLAAPGEPTVTGTVMLKAGERDALLAGRLYVSLYTRADPGGTRGQLVLSSGR